MTVCSFAKIIFLNLHPFPIIISASYRKIKMKNYQVTFIVLLLGIVILLLFRLNPPEQTFDTFLPACKQLILANKGDLDSNNNHKCGHLWSKINEIVIADARFVSSSGHVYLSQDRLNSIVQFACTSIAQEWLKKNQDLDEIELRKYINSCMEPDDEFINFIQFWWALKQNSLISQ